MLDWQLCQICYPLEIKLLLLLLLLLLFVCDDVLRPSQQSFSHVGAFSWVEPVLSNEDKVSLMALKYVEKERT